LANLYKYAYIERKTTKQKTKTNCILTFNISHATNLGVECFDKGGAAREPEAGVEASASLEVLELELVVFHITESHVVHASTPVGGSARLASSRVAFHGRRPVKNGKENDISGCTIKTLL
jgi:hypothetical protein